MSGRILVVDDIATNRMVLRAKLAASYYEVVQAENGTEALEKTKSEQPDLILLDILGSVDIHLDAMRAATRFQFAA